MIIIVDGNYLAYRTFHKSPPLSNSKGFPTAVINSVLNLILTLKEKHQPEELYVVFDAKGKTWRHEQYEEYKATREKMPEDLISQLEKLIEIVPKMNIPLITQKGVEADDVINTLAKNADDEVYIVTKDKDLFQIVGGNIKVLDTQTGELLGEDYVRRKYDIEPSQLLDLLALSGDSSDNIPGVNKIGDKTAAKLLNKYGSLDGIYENINELKGKQKENLENDKDNAYLSRDLVRLTEVDELDIQRQDKPEELMNILAELELNKILDRLFDKDDVDIKAEEMEQAKTKVETPSHIAASQGKIFVSGGRKYEEYDGHDLSQLEYCYNLKQIIKNGIKVSDKVYDIEIVSWLNDPDNGGLRRIKAETDGMFLSRFTDACIKEMDKLRSNDLEKLYKDIEYPVIFILAEMEKKGIRLDKDAMENVEEALQKAVDEINSKIAEEMGEEINLNSPKQLSKYLFDELGLKPTKKTKTGYSTNEEALKDLAVQNPDKSEIIDDILKYRELNKLLSTYTKTLIDFIDEETGRVYAGFNQTGTATGRLSSTNPNMQNIPIKGEYAGKIRSAFKPADGYKFVALDYSQIELRILAHLTEDDNLIKAYRNNEDIHTLTAMNVFGIDESEVDSDKRRLAKAVNFGIIYGLSPYGLSRDARISPADAKEFINRYFETYPGVSKFIDKVEKETEKRGYAETICGRKRFVQDISSRNKTVARRGQRVAVNAPMQGSAADIIKLAMINCSGHIKKNNLDAHLILQLHDELVFEVKAEIADEFYDKAKEIMESVVDLKVPLVVNGAAADNLGELK